MTVELYQMMAEESNASAAELTCRGAAPVPETRGIFHVEEMPASGKESKKAQNRAKSARAEEPLPAEVEPATTDEEALPVEVEADVFEEPTYETSEEAMARDGLYGEIRRQLEEHGIPPHEVAFIHEASTPAKRAQLFRDVNAGRVRILIGSTEKMGTGTNAQERCKALHHLDCPWRPADISQREGRILRQGNTWPEVDIFTYVTEGSFDAFLWQLQESKQRFISQILAGEVTARTAEDVDQSVLTAAQIKAIASGNPKVLERVGVEVEITKLERLYSAWLASRNRYRAEIKTLPADIEIIEREAASHRRAIETRDREIAGARAAKEIARAAAKQGGREESDSIFEITLRTRVGSEETITFRRREDAGAHLRQLAFTVARQALSYGSVTREVGAYLGFKVHVTASAPLTAGSAFATLVAEPEIMLKLEGAEVGYACSIGDSDAGILQSMDAQLRHVERRLETAGRRLSTYKRRLETIEQDLAGGWEHAERYQELRARLEALNLELASEDLDLDSGNGPTVLDRDAFNPVANTVLISPLIANEEADEANQDALQEIAEPAALKVAMAGDNATGFPEPDSEERVETPSLWPEEVETGGPMLPEIPLSLASGSEPESPVLPPPTAGEAEAPHVEANHPLAAYAPISANTWDEIFGFAEPAGKKIAKPRRRGERKKEAGAAEVTQLGFAFD